MGKELSDAFLAQMRAEMAKINEFREEYLRAWLAENAGVLPSECMIFQKQSPLGFSMWVERKDTSPLVKALQRAEQAEQALERVEAELDRLAAYTSPESTGSVYWHTRGTHDAVQFIRTALAGRP